MRVVRRLTIVLVALGAAWPAFASPASMRLARLVDGYWAASLAADPLRATDAGVHLYDDRLDGGAGVGTLAAQLALEFDSLAQLAQIDPASLEGEDRTTWDLFRRDRLLAIEGFAFQRELLPFSPFAGVPLELGLRGAGAGSQPFATARDHDAWLRRLDAFPAWADQAIAAMRRGAGNGIVQPRVIAERLLPMLDLLSTDDPAKSVFRRPLDALPTGVPAADAARLRLAYERAIRERVAPAYRRLATFVREEYLPSARATVGNGDLPLGPRWYAYELRRQTTLELSPAAVEAQGLADIARVGIDFDRLLGAAYGKGERRALLEALRADPRFAYAPGPDGLEAYRAAVQQAQARVPTLLDGAPVVPAIRVAAAPVGLSVPASGSPLLVAGSGAEAATLRLQVTSRVLGGAYPGEQLRRLVAQRAAAIPAYRRAAAYGAFVCGWDAYAQSLAREVGVDDEATVDLGILARQMAYAAGVVVDVGIHANHWTRAQAVDYLLANTADTPAEAGTAVDRIIAVPGEAAAAGLGAMAFRQLRARAERDLGPRFDLRAFHRAVLEGGALPLDLLDARVAAWIALRKSLP